MASSTRLEALNAHIGDLVIGFNALQAEKKALQAAAQRLPIINAELQNLMDDAQTVLDRINTLQGTAYTLAQIRKRYTVSTPEAIPVSVDPAQVAAINAELQKALDAGQLD